MSHDDIAGGVQGEIFELSIFLKQLKSFEKMKKMPRIVSSVKIELQKMKKNY